MTKDIPIENNSVWINKKFGTYYEVLDKVINCTNAQAEQRMIRYCPVGLSEVSGINKIYVREVSEFLQKFEPLASAKES